MIFKNLEISIVSKQRQNEITHRNFDVTDITSAFGDLRFTPINIGIKTLYNPELQNA